MCQTKPDDGGAYQRHDEQVNRSTQNLSVALLETIQVADGLGQLKPTSKVLEVKAKAPPPSEQGSKQICSFCISG